MKEMKEMTVDKQFYLGPYYVVEDDTWTLLWRCGEDGNFQELRGEERGNDIVLLAPNIRIDGLSRVMTFDKYSKAVELEVDATLIEAEKQALLVGLPLEKVLELRWGFVSSVY